LHWSSSSSLCHARCSSALILLQLRWTLYASSIGCRRVRASQLNATMAGAICDPLDLTRIGVGENLRVLGLSGVRAA
jgi:hypothetical protein